MHDKALRYFLTVVRAGSVRRAADQLNVAASAISRHVSDLEYHFNTPLLERLSRGVVPTEAGNIVVEHAQRALENVEFLEDRLRSLRGVQEGTVRICCGSSWAGDLMKNGLKPFAAKYPNVSWRVSVGTTNTILAAVVNGEADVGLVYNPPAHEDIATKKIAKSGLYALMAPSTEYANILGPKRLKDLAHIPAALSPPTHGVRQLIGQVEANDGFRLIAKLETDSGNLKLQFVLSGLGMTLSPRFVADHELRAGKLIAIRLTDPILEQGAAHLVVRAKRRLPEATERLVEFLAANLTAYSASA